MIETAEENEAAFAIIESLMRKGDDGRTPEEEALLESLISLVEQFEKSAYGLSEGTPLGVLQLLMESNDLKSTELGPILGGHGRVSDVLSGRQSISKEQATRLAQLFNVSVTGFM